MSAVRAAVVGCGHFGRHHAEKYAACAGARLVAVVDRDAAAAQSLAERLGVLALTDAGDLPGLADAASVAVPTSSHLEVASRLLEGGLHVLVEKPLATTLADASALIALAARHERILQVGHLERFNAAVLALDDVIDRPLFIESHRIAPFSERGTDVDVVLDLMIHDIDLIQLLVGRPLAAVDAVGVPVLSGRDDIANAQAALRRRLRRQRHREPRQLQERAAHAPVPARRLRLDRFFGGQRHDRAQGPGARRGPSRASRWSSARSAPTTR